MKNKRVKFFRYFMLTTILLVLMGCKKEQAAENDNVVNIGVLIPLNGAQTQAGREAKFLLELIEDTINEPSEINLPFHEGIGLPNLNGARVNFVFGDSSTPDIAMIEAERLITEENIIGIVGSLSSASTKTVMVPAERYEVIVMSEGTSEALVNSEYEYFIRSFPGDETFIKDTFEYLQSLSNKSDQPIKKIALVSEDSEFGANIASIERKWAKKMGFEIIEDISYSSSASNVTSEVLRVKKSNPDAIVMSSYIADALLFMSTFKEQNYFPPILVGQRGGFASSDFIANLQGDASYVFSTARWNNDIEHEVAQEMAQLYKEEYSGGIELIGDVMSVGWNAYLLAIAANQAGATDSVSIREEMSEGLEIDPDQDPTGLSGYQYSSNGQNTFAEAIMIQIQNGKMVTVYPEDVAKEEEVYPAPGWNRR